MPRKTKPTDETADRPTYLNEHPDAMHLPSSPKLSDGEGAAEDIRRAAEFAEAHERNLVVEFDVETREFRLFTVPYRLDELGDA